MTEPAPEPTLADLMAAINAIAQTQATHGEALAAVEVKLDTVASEQQIISGKLDQLTQDVMAVKVDTGFIDRHIGDFQAWARAHQNNPNAHRPAA